MREKYFATAKHVASKNKSIKELSLYAKEFFKAFLKNRWNFHTLVNRAYFCAYDPFTNCLDFWLAGSWKTTSENLSLAVMDFRQLPGFTEKEEDSMYKPYFDMFMNIFGLSNYHEASCVAEDMQGQGNGAEGHSTCGEGNVHSQLREKILHVRAHKVLAVGRPIGHQ